jgi:hypothetical protein
MKKISDNTYLIEGNLYAKSDVRIYPSLVEKNILHVKGDVIAYANKPNNMKPEDVWVDDLDEIDLKFYDIVAFSDFIIRPPKLSVFTPL